MQPEWLAWAKQLQSIAQAGLEYSTDKYDRERFAQIREIGIEILQSYTGIDTKKIEELFAGESGYQTPKIDVRAAIFNSKSELLMVKEKVDDKWSMPGGWADIGLSLRENILKEAKEEAGADVVPTRVIAILDRKNFIDDAFPYSVYKIFVECEFIRNQFTDNIETSEQGFFSRHTLPELSTGRNTLRQIELCFDAREKNQLEARFD